MSNRSLCVLATLLLCASAALGMPCKAYPGDPNVPDELESCFVVWDKNTPMSSSPLHLVLSDGGTALGYRICDLEEPASNSSIPWCPEKDGKEIIALGEWCNRLRVLPLPQGGTEAMRAVLVTEVCVRLGA